MSRRLPIALAAAAALSATIAWQVHSFARPSLGGAPGRPHVPGTVRDEPGTEVNEVALGWMGTALERPLFREDRRPAKASDDAPLQVDEPIRLTGVIIGPFGNRAIFMIANNPKPIVVAEGARIGGYVLRSIEPGRAMVELGGNVRTLQPTFAEGERPLHH